MPAGQPLWDDSESDLTEYDYSDDEEEEEEVLKTVPARHPPDKKGKAKAKENPAFLRPPRTAQYTPQALHGTMRV
jgi:hypothetical protein